MKRARHEHHERNAPTRAARQAVAGREAEILDALNIPWRSGRPHIDCPYTAHGGKDDWRWDEKRPGALHLQQGGVDLRVL